MAITAIVARTIKMDGQTITQPTSSYTDDEMKKYSGVVIAGAVNVPVSLAFKMAAIVVAVLDSDQAVVVKTNSTSSPGDTFTVSTGNELLWWKDAPMANPFTTDVTTLFISNSGTKDAKVNIALLCHAEA